MRLVKWEKYIFEVRLKLYHKIFDTQNEVNLIGVPLCYKADLLKFLLKPKIEYERFESTKIYCPIVKQSIFYAI